LVERLSEESLFETRDTQHWNLVKQTTNNPFKFGTSLLLLIIIFFT
jgi:hypothetical protein